MQVYRTFVGDMYLGKDSVSLGILDDKEKKWEENVRKTIDKYINKDSVCIDVGAQLGYFTLYMAKKCQFVFSFEPNQFSAKYLFENIKLNNLHNVILFNNGCSDKNIKGCFGSTHGIVENYDIKNNSASWEVLEFLEGDIILIRLDDFLSSLPKLDLIKIDAQANDLMVMRGAINLIKKHKPVVIFEIDHPSRLREHKHKKEDYFIFANSINYEISIIGDHDFLMVPK